MVAIQLEDGNLLGSVRSKCKDQAQVRLNAPRLSLSVGLPMASFGSFVGSGGCLVFVGAPHRSFRHRRFTSSTSLQGMPGSHEACGSRLERGACNI